MQIVSEKNWAEIEESTKIVRDAWGPVRLAIFNAANRVLTAPRRTLQTVLGHRDSPDLDLQHPWLPKWGALTSRPFHDPTRFAWNATLEANHAVIKRELVELLDRRVAFERAHYSSEGSPWKTFYFYLHGKRMAENCARCPQTAAILESLPINHAHICFSALPPGAELHPHSGPTNASLICHFGVLGCEGVTIYAGREERTFEEGKALILDDTFVHSVVHRGPTTRYTLMITLWHYDLNPIERRALKVILRRMLS